MFCQTDEGSPSCHSCSGLLQRKDCVTGFVLLSVAAVRGRGKVLICDKGPYKSADGNPAGTELIFQKFEHRENRIKLISKSLLVVFYMKNFLEKF